MTSASLRPMIERIFAPWKRAKTRPGSRGGAVRKTIGCLEQLERREVLNATYHGGQLLEHVEVQAVYLGSNWLTQPQLQLEAARLDGFLDYLVDSPYMDMLTDAGYLVGQGTATAGARINANLSAFNTITDADIRGVLRQAIDLSLVQQPTADRLYVVYVESGRGVNFGGVTSQSGMTGYHSAFAGADRQGVPFDIHYVVVPHPGSPNPTSIVNGYDQTLVLGGASGGSFRPSFGNVTATAAITRTDEVQSLTVSGGPGGTVQLAFGGVTGSPATALEFEGLSPTADEVEAHLRTIPALSSSTAAQVTGNDGGPFTITFGGSLSGVNVEQITAIVDGGASASVTTPQEGILPTAAQVDASLETIPALNGRVQVRGNPGGPFRIQLSDVTPAAISVAAANITGGITATISTADSDFDQLTSATSRQIANAVTNPNNNFRTRGWFDDQFNSEIADLGVPAAQIASVHSRLGPNQYYVQHVFNQNRQRIEPSTADDVLTTSPTITSVTMLSLTRAQISWAPVAGATGYRVMLVNGSQTTLLSRVPASQTSTILSNLPPGATLTFRVEAYNAAHVRSADLTFAVPNPPLTAPQNFQAAATSATSVQLRWNVNRSAAGYRIYMISGTKRTLLASVGEVGNVDQSLITHTINGLKPGSTVSFRIEAFRGGRSLSSVTRTVKLPQLALVAPLVTATAVNGNPAVVKLTWNPVAAAQGFRIYWQNGTRRVLIRTMPASATTATISGLPAGTRYQVQAFRGTQTASSAWVHV
jgi:hypothetical protein